MNRSQEIQDIIVLGAGATKSEAPHLGLLQRELLMDYFDHWTKMIRLGSPRSKEESRDYNRFFRLCRFMKSIFNIDLGSYTKSEQYNNEIKEILFPSFEEILGLIDTSLNQETYFKGYGSLHSVGEYDLQNELQDQVKSRYDNHISSTEKDIHEESMAQIRNDFVFAISDVLTRNLERPLGLHRTLIDKLSNPKNK
jgi:hypothetical protein